MIIAERHRILRRFVVQGRGASSGGVTHENKNVISNIFTSFLYLMKNISFIIKN